MSSISVNFHNELQAAAALCEARFPRAAVALRELAENEPLPAPSVRERRRLLRLLRTRFYSLLSRSAASRAIATQWAEWEPAGSSPAPATRDWYFSRLTEAGFQPIAWRQTYDDLSD